MKELAKYPRTLGSFLEDQIGMGLMEFALVGLLIVVICILGYLAAAL